MNYGFYVSGEAGRLKSLYEIDALSIKASCVVHDGPLDSSLENILRKKNVRYYHYNGGIDGDFSDYLCEILEVSNIDYCFCFGLKILKGRLLDMYKWKIINFHPSLLPSFAGLNAIDQALESSALIMGNTAHFIDKGIDTGPIIMQSIISKFDYEGYQSFLNLQLIMLKQISIWLNENRIVIEGGSVHVKDANYTVGDFIPAVEFITK